MWGFSPCTIMRYNSSPSCRSFTKQENNLFFAVGGGERSQVSESFYLQSVIDGFV